MRTYFFDVTDIMVYVRTETTISGIQRVSFEIVRRMAEHHGAEAVKLSYWDARRREYLCLDSEHFLAMEEFDTAELHRLFFGTSGAALRRAAPTLARYRDRPLKYYFHLARRHLNAYQGNEAHFKKYGSSLEDWRSYHQGRSARPQQEEVVRTPVRDLAKGGDSLVILGATWAIDGIDACLEGLVRDRGLEIRMLIHDLIPIITPEHIAGDFSQEFYRWLKTSLGYCAGYFANSQNTARDLRAFMQEIGVEKPVEVVPLAQKFTQAAHKTETAPEGAFAARVADSLGLRREILNIKKVPYVLVVGTIESRKNVWRLAQAWARLSREEGIEVPKLVFAGKPGWCNEDFNQLVSATGGLGGWIQFADRPTDRELAFLYENCLFTAMVSFYEGWGLPVGESLSFGKTAVVADNSSLPEVGGDMVEYCDAHSLDSIHAACRRLITEPEHRAALEARIARTDLRTWDDVTQGFVTALSAEG